MSIMDQKLGCYVVILSIQTQTKKQQKSSCGSSHGNPRQTLSSDRANHIRERWNVSKTPHPHVSLFSYVKRIAGCQELLTPIPKMAP